LFSQAEYLGPIGAKRVSFGLFEGVKCFHSLCNQSFVILYAGAPVLQREEHPEAEAQQWSN